MKFFKVLLTLILIVAIFVAGAYAGIKITNYTPIGNETTYEVGDIEEKISELSDLTTVEDRVATTETFKENKQVFGKNVPLTNKKLVVKYEGIIKVATDLSKAKIELEQKDDGAADINVTLKGCKISDIYIDEKSWEYLDSKSFVFNRLKPEDDKELRNMCIENLEKLAEDSDLVERGNDQAKTAVESLLNLSYPDANVHVEVR